MNQNTCLYCGDSFIGKRSDAKFCTSTCKAKYWEEKKANGKALPPVKLSDGLRGVVGSKPSKEDEKPKTFTKEIQIETEDYKKGKALLSQLQTSISRLNQEKKKLFEQAEFIAGRNGGIYYVAGATAGAYIADKHLKDTEKVLLGAGAGLAAGLILDKLFENDREKEKKKEIAEISIKIHEIDVSLTSIHSYISNLENTLKTIPQYEKKTIEIPLPAISSFFPSTPKEALPLPEPEKVKETTKIENKVRTLPAPAISEKIISSQELQRMDYKALNFQGKWNTLFGYPSVNFHCVLTGMSGEGKSTFAIQFANYLAEKFGRVLYISGEEGFSKTFKDKFINNNAIAEELFVADLRSYEEIVKEIAPDNFHFIFIDSLDNMRIDAEKMKLIREKYKESALITISQSTKGGKMRGSYEIVHDCDMGVKVENGLATTTKNRFKEKGMQMRVFEV